MPPPSLKPENRQKNLLKFRIIPIAPIVDHGLAPLYNYMCNVHDLLKTTQDVINRAGNTA